MFGFVCVTKDNFDLHKNSTPIRGKSIQIIEKKKTDTEYKTPPTKAFNGSILQFELIHPRHSHPLRTTMFNFSSVFFSSSSCFLFSSLKKPLPMKHKRSDFFSNNYFDSKAPEAHCIIVWDFFSLRSPYPNRLL